jgi:hypothetical protein
MGNDAIKFPNGIYTKTASGIIVHNHFIFYIVDRRKKLLLIIVPWIFVKLPRSNEAEEILEINTCAGF